MPTTPNYLLPYPLATDPADVPLDMRELAEATEAALNGFDTRDDTQDTTLASLNSRVTALETATPPTAAVQLIQDKLLVATGPIDFTSIPATYKHLFIDWQLRTVTATAFEYVMVRFNGDAGSNYFTHLIAATAATVTGTGLDSQTAARAGITVGDTAAANIAGGGRIDVPNYAQTVFHKNFIASGGTRVPTGTAIGIDIDFGRWASTAAVNRIQLFAGTALDVNWKAGSRATLYGAQ